MKLRLIHVTNFRSIEDSNPIRVGDSLCLVGKNEAGKSAVLQALCGLNPHPDTPFVYDKERDYPRRNLGQYEQRHGKNGAQVIRTEWDLEKGEIESLRREFGAEVITDAPLVVSRRYGDAAPRFEPPIDFAKAVASFIAKADLLDEELTQVAKAKTTDELRDTLEKLKRTPKQEALLQKLNSLPDKNITGAVKAKLEPNFPQFMYFSYYDRMVGQIRLDTFNQRKANANPPIEVGEQVFVDFLSLAGTSVDGIVSSTTYESLNARCEAASAQITDQLKEYWSQNAFLEIEVRVTKGEPGDPAPFNEGIVARARVKNNLHRLTLPFSERSAGFIWFFSFLVKFSQVQMNAGKQLVLLLDEPGLTLHAKAQQDLLRYFNEKLTPRHQLIFSTHSPFLIPVDDLASIRIVEDRVTSPKPGLWVSDGTKVRDDIMAVDRDTLFPLQGALGYEVTQSLFVGKHTLLVEGPGDVIYLHVLSAALKKRGRIGLDSRWSVCPAGGLDKIQSFVSLFWSAKLDIAVLTDFAKRDQRKIDTLINGKILEGSRILTMASLLGLPEADVEDIFDPAIYAALVSDAMSLQGTDRIDAAKIVAETSDTRLLKKVEALTRLLPPTAVEFNHFAPADWLIRHPEILEADTAQINQTLDRGEIVIKALNRLLP